MSNEVHRAIGRGRELAAFRDLLDQTDTDRARFLVLRGEPGVGKTTLLVHLARLAGGRGFTVLERCATELERGTPVPVLVDLLESHLATRADPTERFEMHRTVRDALERLAAERPTLLALDDLHWADAASLELMSHLLRRPPRGPLLIAASLGPGRAPAGVEAAIEAAVRNGAAREMEIGPLTAAQAGEILDEADPAQRDRLYRESGGNPFYLEQLVRDAGRSGGVPPAVAATIRGELEALPEPARTLAEAGAVAGDPFEIDLAAEIAELTAAEGLTAIDELVARGLVRPTEVARRFRFRHPLARTAVYEGAAPGSRLAAHGRAAAALAARGVPALARAPHVEASAAAGDRDGIATLLEAALQDDPARWLPGVQRLLSADAARLDAHAPRLVPGADRLREIVSQAEASAADGRLADAETELRAALDELRRRRPPPAAGLTALSDREHEVARLVRHRRTNAQIAEELFVSLKTVETHLRNIFAKLGVSSRVEVAELVERDEHP
jgi:predicted ATPase/DNA-binding CsgD family transcriptional regulator